MQRRDAIGGKDAAQQCPAGDGSDRCAQCIADGVVAADQRRDDGRAGGGSISASQCRSRINRAAPSWAMTARRSSRSGPSLSAVERSGSSPWGISSRIDPNAWSRSALSASVSIARIAGGHSFAAAGLSAVSHSVMAACSRSGMPAPSLPLRKQADRSICERHYFRISTTKSVMTRRRPSGFTASKRTRFQAWPPFQSTSALGSAPGP